MWFGTRRKKRRSALTLKEIFVMLHIFSFFKKERGSFTRLLTEPTTKDVLSLPFAAKCGLG
jgi:hypothetical protein